MSLLRLLKCVQSEDVQRHEGRIKGRSVLKGQTVESPSCRLLSDERPLVGQLLETTLEQQPFQFEVIKHVGTG